MSIQSQLNADALSALPLIKRVINNADAFESNQMRHAALRSCSNSLTRVSDMTEQQLTDFQIDLLDHFVALGWIESVEGAD